MGQDRGRLKKAKAALTPSFLLACMSDQLFHRNIPSFSMDHLSWIFPCIPCQDLPNPKTTSVYERKVSKEALVLCSAVTKIPVRSSHPSSYQ